MVVEQQLFHSFIFCEGIFHSLICINSKSRGLTQADIPLKLMKTSPEGGVSSVSLDFINDISNKSTLKMFAYVSISNHF